MFRQPPPERFINYQLQASLGAQRQPVKTKVKGLRRGRRGRKGDQFARERRAEEIFKFGEKSSFDEIMQDYFYDQSLIDHAWAALWRGSRF